MKSIAGNLAAPFPYFGGKANACAEVWTARKWTARKGYALTDEAVANSESETIWCSPHCATERNVNAELFMESA